VVEELQEQRKSWLHIRDNLHETVPKNKHDKFKLVIIKQCALKLLWVKFYFDPMIKYYGSYAYTYALRVISRYFFFNFAV